MSFVRIVVNFFDDADCLNFTAPSDAAIIKKNLRIQSQVSDCRQIHLKIPSNVIKYIWRDFNVS